MEDEFFCEECGEEISEDYFRGHGSVCFECEEQRKDGEAESADYAWHGL
jgi:hypothetical protein